MTIGALGEDQACATTWQGGKEKRLVTILEGRISLCFGVLLQ